MIIGTRSGFDSPRLHKTRVYATRVFTFIHTFNTMLSDAETALLGVRPMPPKRKRGRPAKPVTGRDGKKIQGLSYHKPTGNYYATYSDPRAYFGSDFDRAYILYQEWDAKQRGETVTIPTTGGKQCKCERMC